MKTRKTISMLLALAMVLALFCNIGMPGVSAAEADATLTVDLSPSANTGEIVHGAAGFLYGVSSDGVPTTNTIVPLKSKILCTKGAVGTEHPYGDALDVAKTFLESGGQQVMMYNSNYYGVFGVTATIDRYCEDLQKYICPAVVAWKAAWKEEHGTPDAPKDGTGKVVDIDKAICYIPINEGTPAGNNFYQAWERYYDSIKAVDTNAYVVGPNSSNYNNNFSRGQNFSGFIQYCANNNCMPDIITWHELDTSDLRDMGSHMDSFRALWAKIDWTTYNNDHGTTGIPEIPQICFNEYAEMAYCGVPGRLVNWISRLEDEKITACLPFWHQANNLNDLAAGANEGNGAWWLYQWYGNMSGNTQPVTSSTAYTGLYGVSTMDEAKKLSTTLLGGFTGDIAVQMNNVTDTETFADAEYVNITVQETSYTGFHGAAQSTPTIIKGIYPVNEDGSVTVIIPNALFESAYNVTMTRVSEADLAAAGMVLIGSSGDVYEAESAAVSGGASAGKPSTSPSYHMSNDRAVNMPTNGVLTYTINVPTDGKYKLEFLYGNGQGTVRNDMNSHNPVNAVQTFALDDGAAVPVTMESTLFQTMCGMKTLYYDLTAGTHTISIKTTSRISSGMLYHDCLRVVYAGVYAEPVPAFNTVYEAELADFNKLLGNADSTVNTQSDIIGYSGGGYVKGLSARSVPEGGGIRYTIVVGDSGLYNLSLQYASNEAGTANIYVGNTATVLTRVNKTVELPAGDGWQSATASVYLQKGINVVDVDASADIALDYLRVRALASQDYSTTIEAEDAIPAAMEGKIKVAESDGASGGEYVVGMKGAYADANYLELHYNAPAAGKYQMQVFHSNEDLAGSHSYNIKTTDKYAVFEVNGESDSPSFNVLDHGDSNKDASVEEEAASAYDNLLYFVDCGDHDPSTVSEGDSFGEYSSVTEQMWGEDPATGYYWGLVMENANEQDLGTTGGVTSSASDKAIYTNYQRALSNSQSDLTDGKLKTETYRYAHGQDSAGINPRYLSYRFELEPQEYEVTVGTSAAWSNSIDPTITLSASGVEPVAKQVIGSTNQVNSIIIDLTGAETNERGLVELSLKITATSPTVAANYITIAAKSVYYFVDCGDHDPTTVSEGEALGVLNSVTDRLYGKDVSGYSWGVVMEDSREVETPHVGGGGTRSTDNAVYTNFQKALSNSDDECQDGRAKTATCRYSHNQDSSGINPRYVSYKFELDPAKYDVTVCMGNTWNNAGNPTVTVSAAGVQSVAQAYSVGSNANVEKTMTIDLTGAETNDAGRVELSVRATSTNPTIQMNYIFISKASAVEESAEEPAEKPDGIELPGGAIVDAENLPDDIYLGNLTKDVPWMIDMRSVKDDTDRYFFINTFSDDTFREKTITLDLVKGDNTIKIYNDNSWNVTFGGSTSVPATEWVNNYAPNFDKFVITPMALDTPVAQEDAFNVLVTAGQGGTVIADKNTVGANGSYSLTICPAEENKAKVLINGVDYSRKLVADENGAYTLTISDVTSDQNISVFFGNFVHEHYYVAVITEPTCTEAGYTTYTCDCGDSYVADEVAALGHNFVNGVCTRCNEKEVVENPFEDVLSGAFYFDAVKWAADNGITNGLEPGLFAPDKAVTRAQIVTMLWRAAGCPQVETAAGFKDVKADAYYYDAVAWAVAEGITNGVGKNMFAPNDFCTRGQIMTFLWRYMEQPKAEAAAAFSDVPADEYYTEAIAWAVEAKVAEGITEELFKPDNDCTRAQAITFLYRAIAE